MNNQQVDKIMKLFDEERRKELFGDKIDLSPEERMLLQEYIHDYLNPVWKDVFGDGYIPTNLEISNIGHVRNKVTKRLWTFENMEGNDYNWVGVSYQGKSHTCGVHRLVAQAFILNPENKAEVNHINGNKRFNWYKNLEWATRQENADHARIFGLIKIGEDAPTAKHTEQEVHEVCKLAEKGLGAEEISKTLNLSKSFVVGILYRGEWNHISSQYKMPRSKKFHDETTIHEICKLLSKGKRPVEISKELANLHVKWEDVQSIRIGKSWRRISNQYNIPGLEKNDITEQRSSDKIRELLEKGIMDTDTIANMLGIEKSKYKKQYIMKVRRNYLRKLGKDKTSTTIENAEKQK